MSTRYIPESSGLPGVFMVSNGAQLINAVVDLAACNPRTGLLMKQTLNYRDIQFRIAMEEDVQGRVQVAFYPIFDRDFETDVFGSIFIAGSQDHDNGNRILRRYFARLVNGGGYEITLTTVIQNHEQKTVKFTSRSYAFGPNETHLDALVDVDADEAARVEFVRLVASRVFTDGLKIVP